MPKKLIEINKFTGGVVSTPSATDTDEQSAKYSSNIDPQTAAGRLQGIDSDKKLTIDGFSGTGTAQTVTAIKELITVADKTDNSKINLVIGRGTSDTLDVINTVSLVSNLYGTYVPITDLGIGLQSLESEYHFDSYEDKVYIGMGGGTNTDAKVVLKPVGKTMSGGDKGGIGLFDAKLLPPGAGVGTTTSGIDSFSGIFSEFMSFPIHNQTIALAQDDADTPADKIFPDYDVILEATPGVTLFAALANGSTRTIENLLIGQIFKTQSTTDFTDNAMVGWKKYDYDKSSSGVVVGDLFMYCGNTSEGAPVLRFLGNSVTQAPAFMYAIKDESSSLYKISTTTTPDATAFGAVSEFTIAKNSDGNTQGFSRTSSRISSIGLFNFDIWGSGYISAFSGCSSPPLFNSLNLVDDNANPHTQSSNTFYKNGHLKILYRHGVFYISSKSVTTALYRLNAIDFYSLTTTPALLDDITLDFTRIPDQLEA